MHPARATGPMSLTGRFTDWWTYLIAPAACGTLAITTYEHGAKAALPAGTPAAEGLEPTPGTNQ